MLQSLQLLPPDSLFQVLETYKQDPNPEKIDLSVGVLTDNSAQAFVFESVQSATRKLDTSNFNYLPLQGHKKFLAQTAKLFLDTEDLGEIAMQQVCGGTHACRIFADLTLRNKKVKIWIGTPTWANHFELFKHLDMETFDHLDQEENPSLENYKTAIQNANAGDILLIQGGAAHNPTGRNLSLSQIQELIPLLEEKSVVVYIDFAYLGLGESIEKDSEVTKYLFQELEDVALGVSYSKNGSLYQHRTGALYIKTKQKAVIESHLQNLVRGNISNPPAFGANVMSYVLANEYDRWTEELDQAKTRLDTARERFCDHLGPEFEGLKQGSGLFGLLPLTTEQILYLRENHSIYIPNSGRVSFGGMALDKIPSLAQTIKKVL